MEQTPGYTVRARLPEPCQGCPCTQPQPRSSRQAGLSDMLRAPTCWLEVTPRALPAGPLWGMHTWEKLSGAEPGGSAIPGPLERHEALC